MDILKLIKTPSSRNRFMREMQPYLKTMYRAALRLTNNEHDAEDIIQDFLIKLYEKKVEIKSLDNPSTWMLRGVYNQYIDHLRKSKRNPIDLADSHNEKSLDELSNGQPDPHVITVQHSELRRLQQALNELPEDHRVLIIFHDIEGYTLAELEKVLGIPLGTLKSRLHRARKSLKNSLFMEPFIEPRRDTG